MDDTPRIPREIRDRARILVVEDNLLNQKLDFFLLSSWGLKCRICDNGVAALAAIMHSPPWDIVLMDIRMPELDGLQTTKLIRGDLRMSMPIIGITAYATPGEKERCLAAGMNDYISKPVNEEELHGLLARYLVPAAPVAQP